MKKITKFLDSVMGGIKRTCIAKALAVFAVASIAINANAEAVDAQGVITGIDKLVGKTQDELLNNVTSTTFPTDPEKQFFLYNVKTGRLLNAGGYWGTHVALKEYGKPLAVMNAGKTSLIGGYQRIKLIMEMAGTQGKFVGYYGVPSETEPDNGTYVDRSSYDVYGWILEEVKDENRQNKQKTYKLYTYCWDGSEFSKAKKYYLCSNKGLVDAKKNCEAYPEDSLTVENSKFAGYDEWRFLSYKQILDLQAKNADELNDALELSFKLKCPGFSRGDNDITSWKTYNYATEVSNSTDDGFARFGLFKYYNTIAGPNTDPGSFTNDLGMQTEKDGAVDKYTFDGEEYYNPWVVTDTYTDSKGNEIEIGKTNTEAKPYQRNLSKYFCASITNKRGTIYQDIVVTTPGRYQIECKGYSTTEKAKLFAGVLKSDNKTMVGQVKTRTLNQVSNMSQAVQEALHVSEKNVDYAGKNFYGSRQYINTVYVTVTDDDMTAGKATIRLGIMVGDDQNDKTVEGDEWTVFDDFRMLYAAKEVTEDLILDEYRDNLSYLVNCPTPMENKTLHLNKTFTLGKWNSFILPVNLNKKQVTEAFGGDARLAKLTRLTDTGIEFTSVNLLDSNSTAIEAYMPYIIFPVKGPDQTEAYTANYQQNGQTKRLNINIPANHYVIGKVSMPTTTEGVKANDWSNMNKTTWTTTVTGGNDDIKAYGTFARTFGTVQTDKEDGTYTWKNDGTIIPGRPTLEHSYFFDKGNMYHSTGRPRGLRGFSCWFETTGSQNSLQFTLDGVSQGTTGIEDILADYEQPVSRFANGIYNLNGQLVKQGYSTAGLPSCLYIVNGKKCIVR